MGSTYGTATVLTTGSVCLTFLVKEAVGNADDVDIELGALAEEAEAVGDASAVANRVASRLVGDLVAAVNALAVGAGVGSLLNSPGVDGRTNAGSSGGGGEESDDSVGIHLEGC